MDPNLTPYQQKLIRQACDAMDYYIFDKYKDMFHAFGSDDFIMVLLQERMDRKNAIHKS